MSKEKKPFDSLVELISTKSVMKQEIYRNTKVAFAILTEVIGEVVADLKIALPNIDKNIPISWRMRNEFEVEVILAGDVLIFHMHTNVFQFDKNQSIWKSNYLQKDEDRSYCGIIYVYNFLKDSFIYDRKDDLGYLIARLFVNKENHYFVEGKRQMAFLYNDFSQLQVSKTEFRKIVESILLYALGFDMFIPAYDAMKEMSVSQMEENAKNVPIRTGKRLGFKFQADTDEIS